MIAAGFPGLYRQTDPVFERISQGDVNAVRELTPVLTTGVINQLQHIERPQLTLVIHGAEIAPGSSGGPLVDTCGSVFGINTFGIRDNTLPVTARYALGEDGIRTFLTSIGVQFATRDDCQRAPSAPPAATATPAPSPSAPPGPALPATAPAPSK